MSSSITRIAGQPEYVGVTATVTAPAASTSTPRTMPSSMTLRTGTSGSFTSPSTAKTSSRVSMGRPPLPLGSWEGARHDLHLGQHVPEVLGVPTLPAAEHRGARIGHGEGCLPNHRGH